VSSRQTNRQRRLLITGGSSYLGQHLVPLAQEGFAVVYTFFQSDPLALPGGQVLDIRQAESVRRLVVEWQPEAIIHTVGSNRSSDVAHVIQQGTQNIVAAAQAVSARLIHISTDALFDGRQAPYRESDPPSPIHDYGRAKAAAEWLVAGHDNHVIIRTSLIYGLKIMDRSTEWIAVALSAGRPVMLFVDQIRNPVWAETLSQACLELVDLDFRGVLNVAGRQSMSRAEFGLRLLDWWGIEPGQTLTTGASTGDWPLDCRLDLRLAASLLTTPLAGVDEVLAANRER
jgi:dTDP-4-dehydrorhamnose reductase